MRIQYCSDLHLEFEKNSRYMMKNQLSVNGEILILAGDIIPLHDEFFNNKFFKFISDKYKQVFWVPGNHEFYYKDIGEYSCSYNIELKKNINIVHNIELEYENVKFVFSTLWSRISSANSKIIEISVSDFDSISKGNRKFKTADFNKLHTESVSFLNNSLKNTYKKTVVVTHHLPSKLCNSLLHNKSPINEAFCTDMTYFVEKSNVNFWIYGHSHYNQKPLIIGKTIMLTNQLSYVHYDEHKDFRHNAYFTI